MEKEYKIEIDARILELLGPNLYTNIYYVLAELILMLMMLMPIMCTSFQRKMLFV